MGKIKYLFQKNPKILASLVVILALSLPFVMSQVLREQDIRQGAQSIQSISFNFTPASKTVKVGDSFTVILKLNAESHDIGSLSYTMKYDAAKLQFTEGSTGTALSVVQKTTPTGAYLPTYLNPLNSSVTGNSLSLHTFTFKALAAGEAKVNLTNIKATAKGVGSFLPVANETINASYTISTVAPISPTGITANCAGTTGRDDFCSCDASSQCKSGTCGRIIATPLPKGIQTSKMCHPSPSNAPTPTATITTTPTSKLTITPSVTATPTPTPTRIVTDACTASNNKPEGCTCTENTQCRSNTCTNGKCVAEPKDTIPQGATGLKLSIKIPGIAARTSAIDANPQPKNSSRNVKVQILNNSGQPVAIGNGNNESTRASLHFNPSSFTFEGPINLGTDFVGGNYLVKLSVDNSLYKRLPGILTLTKGKADNTSSTVTLVTGDLNNDNTLGISDWTLMIACIEKKAACSPSIRALADLDDDGKIGEFDVYILQTGFATRNGD